MAMADPVETGLQKNTSLDGEQAVRQRYSAAARKTESQLCCAVSYHPRFLKAIPDEVLERDYGCGDPSPYIQAGDVVLDLGSGGGKLCFIASQIVGSSGRVIGVDCNADMLSLARKHQPQVAENIGYSNVDFRCGRIQDLSLNLERLSEMIGGQSIENVSDWLKLREVEQRLRREKPLIESNSIDCVISNCVLNLVNPQDRQQLFSEIHRVLKVGGRAAISDIVSDEDVPENLKNDPDLWSGCLAGAWREDEFINEFRAAGFAGIQLVTWEHLPWRTVQGIEFRAVTVVAYKPSQDVCLERHQAVIYRGPFARVIDDDGNQFPRGKRIAVCDRTYQALGRPPYEGHFVTVPPRQDVAPSTAVEFDCEQPNRVREPRETKGLQCVDNPSRSEPCCGDDCC